MSPAESTGFFHNLGFPFHPNKPLSKQKLDRIWTIYNRSTPSLSRFAFPRFLNEMERCAKIIGFFPSRVNPFSYVGDIKKTNPSLLWYKSYHRGGKGGLKSPFSCFFLFAPLLFFPIRSRCLQSISLRHETTI